ncbi:molecular chaperone [Pararobbsia alpina]|uniref:fimbrial biogenesis chaperone n=1 Tax=Pararobbsia alpina TaxID=621374 RepID=UPI0039A5BEA8
MSTVTRVAEANVVISTTRAIVPVPPGHTTIRLTNTSTVPSLVQIWADAGDTQSTPESTDAPFEVTPSLFVLGPRESQVVRIDYDTDSTAVSTAASEAPPAKNPAGTSAGVSAHDTTSPRESLYWLNVLDVPSTEPTDPSDPVDLTGTVGSTNAAHTEDSGHGGDTTDALDASKDPGNSAEDNALRFVVHTRIKLIARPRTLSGNALHAPEKLTWRMDSPATLVGVNASRHYVTCAPVFAIASDKRERQLGTHTIAPGEKLEIALTPLTTQDTASDATPNADAVSEPNAEAKGNKDPTRLDPRRIDTPAVTPWSQIVCHAINDYGSIDVFRSKLGAEGKEARDDADHEAGDEPN